jgi:hypothetical protein
MLLLEFYWWLLGFLIAAGILIPVWFYVPGYLFFLENSLLIVLGLTLTRYLLMLPDTWLAKQQITKIAFIFLCVPLVFWAAQSLHTFTTFLDENPVDEHFLSHLESGSQEAFERYLRSEYLLFAVITIIAGAFLPVRLVISIWRTYNKGTA